MTGTEYPDTRHTGEDADTALEYPTSPYVSSESDSYPSAC